MNIGPKLKKPSFAILGAYMFDNKFIQYRTEVCPEIEKIIRPSVGPILEDREI